MAKSRLLSNLFLPELGMGAGYFMLGFRALARGAGGCCTLRRTFRDGFGHASGDVLAGLAELVSALGWEGRRKVTLSAPGSARITPDELTLVCTLAAALRGDVPTMSSHLEWLFGRPPSNEVIEIMERLGHHFRNAELLVIECEITRSAARKPATRSLGLVQSSALH
ncbi:hypothetical protein [Maricaulis sp. MIT060901]|uniref:hypothetical protein n=1 Tax=Maricaulis sp. MIT060901 TaxID=3096993 RepID=UPI00399BC2C9